MAKIKHIIIALLTALSFCSYCQVAVRDAIWRNHDGIWRGNEFRFYGKSTIFAAK